MSIVGGAFVPAIQGYVSDILGSMQISFLVSFVCFAYIGYYFYKESKKQAVAKQQEQEHVEAIK